MNNANFQKQIARLEEQVKQVLVGSRPEAGFWTRTECGDDKWIAKRQECRACGAPMANPPTQVNPPEKQAAAVKAWPKANVME